MENKNCECKEAGFCKRYNTNVSSRDTEFCNGTSGLSPEKEAYYIGRLIKKGKGELNPPSIITQAINFGKAIVKHAANNFQTVSEEIHKERGAICLECVNYLKETSQCAKCGCNVFEKSKWASEDCPDGFWPKLELKVIELPPENPSGGCGCSGS